jgi:hypothetical protein
MAQNNEQATLNNQHATVTKNWTMTRATGKEIIGNHDFGASTNINAIRCVVRDSDGDAIIDFSADVSGAATYSDSHFNLTVDNVFEVYFDDEDTRGLTVDTPFDYGVLITGTDSVDQAPMVGQVTFTDQVVHDDDTAAYESWTTRADRDAVIDALLACNYATTLASDAAASDGTITVTSAALFSPGDNITIIDDTNSESHDIAAGGISGAVITLDATTLANAYTADETVVIKEF